MTECLRKKNLQFGDIKSGMPLCKLKHIIRERRCLQHPSSACGEWLWTLQPFLLPKYWLCHVSYTCQLLSLVRKPHGGLWPLEQNPGWWGARLLQTKLVRVQGVSGEQLDGFSINLLISQSLCRAAACFRQVGSYLKDTLPHLLV